MPEKNNHSRRDFLKVAFASTWGLILAACKMSPADETSAPVETEPVPETDTPAPEPETAAPETSAPATEAPDRTPTETPPPEACFSPLEPVDSAEVGSVGRITFKWELQSGASSYKLIITLPNELIEEYSTELSQFEKYLESLPMNGKYRWQVIAFDNGSNEICASEKFSFNKVPPKRN